MMDNKIIVKHNLNKDRFVWLYAKYANGCNPEKHCTNAIKGKYSKKFTKHSEKFKPGQTIVLDEFPHLNWDAIYICGVSKKGYYARPTKNYPHNVHIAIVPKVGAEDTWEFEEWKMTVQNAVFEYVVSEEELEEKYKDLDEEYVTCRMFRWAVTHYKDTL